VPLVEDLANPYTRPVRSNPPERIVLADFRILVPLAVLLGLLSFSPVASASHVQCGDVITQNTKLDSDVICDPTEYNGQQFFGLVIGADDVTLNLGGHTLLGPDSGGDVIGITDDGTPRDRLRIVNGTITGFRQSIDIDTSSSVIRGINPRTPFGIRLRGNHNVVRRNIADTGYTAIDMTGAGNQSLHNELVSFEGETIVASGSDIRIAHNLVRPKRHGILPGILLLGFADAVVTGNDVSTYTTGIILANGTGASVTRNFVHDNGYVGIGVRSDVSNVDLRRNTANANGTGSEGSGIRVDSPSVTITRNTANDNGFYGIEAVPGVIDGGGNRARGNGNPAQCIGVQCR
jgi:hypothetical protein